MASEHELQKSYDSSIEAGLMPPSQFINIKRVEDAYDNPRPLFFCLTKSILSISNQAAQVLPTEIENLHSKICVVKLYTKKSLTERELNRIRHLQLNMINLSRHVGGLDFLLNTIDSYAITDSVSWITLSPVLGTTLDDLFHDSGGVFPEFFIFHLFIELCGALKYLHSRYIIHNDISGSNVMIRRVPTGLPNVVLIDFDASMIDENAAKSYKDAFLFLLTIGAVAQQVPDEENYFGDQMLRSMNQNHDLIKRIGVLRALGESAMIYFDEHNVDRLWEEFRADAEHRRMQGPSELPGWMDEHIRKELVSDEKIREAVIGEY